MPSLRVATFNVLHGAAPQTGQDDPAQLTAAVAALDADVLALQELDRGQARSSRADQPRLAAAAMPPASWLFAPTVTSPDGEYGIALVSRLPVRWWRVLSLPTARMGLPLLVPTDRGPRLRFVPDEPRRAIAARVQVADAELTVVATHLSFVPGWNLRQLRALARAARTLPGPRLLLGDLNAPAATPTLATGWQRLAGVSTYPSWHPRVQFDHVLWDRAGAPAATARARATPSVGISDHRPLVVELAWEPVSRASSSARPGSAGGRTARPVRM